MMAGNLPTVDYCFGDDGLTLPVGQLSHSLLDSRSSEEFVSTTSSCSSSWNNRTDPFTMENSGCNTMWSSYIKNDNASAMLDSNVDPISSASVPFGGSSLFSSLNLFSDNDESKQPHNLENDNKDVEESSNLSSKYLKKPISSTLSRLDEYLKLPNLTLDSQTALLNSLISQDSTTYEGNSSTSSSSNCTASFDDAKNWDMIICSLCIDSTKKNGVSNDIFVDNNERNIKQDEVDSVSHIRQDSHSRNVTNLDISTNQQQNDSIQDPLARDLIYYSSGLAPSSNNPATVSTNSNPSKCQTKPVLNGKSVLNDLLKDTVRLPKNMPRDANLGFRRTSICKYWQRGICANDDCNFAHGKKELQSTIGVWKTTICHHWKTGTCRVGEACRHAHGEEELQPKNIPAHVLKNKLLHSAHLFNNQRNRKSNVVRR